MGIGDNLLASGMARGKALVGKRVAFGDGDKIIWDQNSEIIFRRNPNVAPPGTESNSGLEWIPFYKGNRLYNRSNGHRWIWNYDFRPTPGEIFLIREEKHYAEKFGKGFIVVEPSVPWFKSVAPNKQWPVERYQALTDQLIAQGYDVAQFLYDRCVRIEGTRKIKTPDFRLAMAVLGRAALYIGPEGGLHHGAAAVGTSAVVLFGGFIPPQVTGYDSHTNLTGGAEACGNLMKCEHCEQAMARISVDEVHTAALAYLGRRA